MLIVDRFIELTDAISSYANTTSDHLPVFARFNPDQPLLSSTLPDEAVPPTLTLRSAYPNPFRATLTLDYALTEVSPIEIQVFDALGHRVRRHALAYQSPGLHRFVFEGAGLSAGVYIVRISAGQQAATRRVVHVD